MSRGGRVAKNTIGIMQGRLSPMVNGQVQAFPWETWRREFDIAAECGFHNIEAIFDEDDFEDNPVYSKLGLAELKSAISGTGVLVRHICADFFMRRPFYRVANRIREQNKEILSRLLDNAAEIGVATIEIPCLDNSQIHSLQDEDLLVRTLEEVLPKAEANGVVLALETSLPSEELARLAARVSHPSLGLTYDTGNSAALGYDTRDEIETYGLLISNVHIKDRVRGGMTVYLGTGNANFVETFQALGKIGYDKGFVLQAARLCDDVGVAREYMGIVRWLINRYL